MDPKRIYEPSDDDTDPSGHISSDENSDEYQLPRRPPGAAAAPRVARPGGSADAPLLPGSHDVDAAACQASTTSAVRGKEGLAGLDGGADQDAEVIHEGDEVWGGVPQLDNALLGHLDADGVAAVPVPTEAEAEDRRHAVVRAAIGALRMSGALTAPQLQRAEQYLEQIRPGVAPMQPLPTAGEMAALAFLMFSNVNLVAGEKGKEEIVGRFDGI